MNVVAFLISIECRLRTWIVWTASAGVVVALLTAGLMFASSAAAADAGFGPSAGALVNVYMLIVPLAALVVGSLTVVRDRERGTLDYLLVQPITRAQLFWSKWTALMLQTLAIVSGGFLALLVTLAVLRVPAQAEDFLQFMSATVLLALAMASCGIAISACSRTTPLALASALGVWLFFVVFADVGAMATALATHLGTAGLLAVTAINPIEAYKIASICALEGSVDVLGPGGRLASDTFGVALMPVMTAVLVIWAAVASTLARVAFGRGRDA